MFIIAYDRSWYLSLFNSRWIILLVVFDLSPEGGIPCSIIDGTSDLSTAIPMYQPPSNGSLTTTLAEELYFHSLQTACHCRDAGIAFGICAWFSLLLVRHGVTVGCVGEALFYYRLGIYLWISFGRSGRKLPRCRQPLVLRWAQTFLGDRTTLRRGRRSTLRRNQGNRSRKIFEHYKIAVKMYHYKCASFSFDRKVQT